METVCDFRLLEINAITYTTPLYFCPEDLFVISDRGKVPHCYDKATLVSSILTIGTIVCQYNIITSSTSGIVFKSLVETLYRF